MTNSYKTRYRIHLRVETSGTTTIVLETSLNIKSHTKHIDAYGYIVGIQELLEWVKRTQLVFECHTPTGHKTERVIIDPSDVYRTIEENEESLVIDSGDDPETQCDYRLVLKVVPIEIVPDYDMPWDNRKLFVRSKDIQDAFLVFDGQTAAEVFDNLARYLGKRGAMTIAHALERTEHNGPVAMRNLHITCSNLDTADYAEVGEQFVRNPEITNYRIQVNHTVDSGIVKSVAYNCKMEAGFPERLTTVVDWVEYGHDEEFAIRAIFEYHLRGLDRFRGADQSMLLSTYGGKTTISINSAFYKVQ